VNVRRILQLFAHLAGSVFRLLPQKKRFAVARRIALTIAPVVRRSPWFARRPSLLDGPREESLRMVLRAMTRARVRFDPEIARIGAEVIPDGPVLLVSGHFQLNIMMSRSVYDVGRTYTIALGGSREPMYYLGTTEPIGKVYSGPQLFVQMRRILTGRSVVLITIEEPVLHEDWVPLDTVVGRRYVSPATFAFALRTGTPIVFAATHLDDKGRVTSSFERPRSTDGAGMTEEFCEFLRKHVAAVKR
jgi:hypothetical protein